MKVEVCINRIEDVIAVQSMAVDRIELCIELGEGGLTPSVGFVERALAISRIPIHVLVRPRNGNFTYSSELLSIIQRDCAYFQTLGVDGLVVGMLDKDQTLPVDYLKKLRDELKEVVLVFHRAFDAVADPLNVLDQLVDIGFDAVLTSGHSGNAFSSMEQLLLWKQHVANKMTVLPGGGIRDDNCLAFQTNAFKWIHLSAKQEIVVDSQSTFYHPRYQLNIEVLKAVITRLKRSY